MKQCVNNFFLSKTSNLQMLEYVGRVRHAHAHHAPMGNHLDKFLQQRGQVGADVPAVSARVLRGDPQLDHPFTETVPGPLHDLVDGVGGQHAPGVPRLAVSALVQAPVSFVLGDFLICFSWCTFSFVLKDFFKFCSLVFFLCNYFD